MFYKLGAKVKVYSIFDDYNESAAAKLKEAGIELTIHPTGVARPSEEEMKLILEEYDAVIIGTSQKIKPFMFKDVQGKRIIATASVGKDHICLPEDKKDQVLVLNTPKANAQSVAEYTIACALSCCKRLIEGADLYSQGKNNKQLSAKPAELYGKTMGVIGAGNVSVRTMEYAQMFGMKLLCWTAHPENHAELLEKSVSFVEIETLVEEADVISVNLPNNNDTKNIISKELVDLMKDDAIFISVSRKDTIDWKALFDKAINNKNFYACVDIDVDNDVVAGLPNIPNVLVTPHVGGSTAETRQRMFIEIADKLVQIYKSAEVSD